MRRILVRSIVVVALVAFAVTSGAGSRPERAGGGHDPGLPANCRLHAEAVFWTQGGQTPSGVWDWTLLGQELAANASACADYYISIPPLAANKTGLRVLQDDAIRALGPRFHPVAEM